MQKRDIGGRLGALPEAEGDNGRSAIIMTPDEDKRTDKSPNASDAWSPSPGIPHLRVTDLLGKAKEAVLEHEGQFYRLRITSNRKLILTK